MLAWVLALFWEGAQAFVPLDADVPPLHYCHTFCVDLRSTCCLPPPQTCETQVSHDYSNSAGGTTVDHVTIDYYCPNICVDLWLLSSTLRYQQYLNQRYHYRGSCVGNSTAQCSDASCWDPCATCPQFTYIAVECGLVDDTTCAPCPLLPGKFFDKGNQDCTNAANWKQCDACTSPSVYANTISSCSALDTTKDISPTSQKCETCKACPPDRYYHKAGDQYHCVTDPQAQCLYTYKDLNNRVQTTLPMPFEWGYKRVPGLHALDITKNDGETEASYAKCDPGFPQQGYIFRGEPAHWDDDCNIQLVGMCAQGYYATIKGNSVTCIQCSNDGGLSIGGLQTTCSCLAGTATASTLEGALGQILLPSAADQYCYDCSKDVELLSSSQVYAHEAVACPVGGIHRCKDGEMMVGTECRACDTGAISTLEKNVCVKCQKGTDFSGNKCVPCDGSQTYCPDEGMTSPVAVTQGCQSGKMLVLKASSETDNECVPCPTAPCMGDFYVFAEGHNMTNPCSETLAEGSSVEFFACYDPAGPSSLSPQFTDDGTFRLAFHAAADKNAIQVCLPVVPSKIRR